MYLEYIFGDEMCLENIFFLLRNVFGTFCFCFERMYLENIDIVSEQKV